MRRAEHRELGPGRLAARPVGDAGQPADGARARPVDGREPERKGRAGSLALHLCPERGLAQRSASDNARSGARARRTLTASRSPLSLLTLDRLVVTDDHAAISRGHKRCASPGEHCADRRMVDRRGEEVPCLGRASSASCSPSAASPSASLPAAGRGRRQDRESTDPRRACRRPGTRAHAPRLRGPRHRRQRRPPRQSRPAGTRHPPTTWPLQVLAGPDPLDRPAAAALVAVGRRKESMPLVGRLADGQTPTVCVTGSPWPDSQ